MAAVIKSAGSEQLFTPLQFCADTSAELLPLPGGGACQVGFRFWPKAGVEHSTARGGKRSGVSGWLLWKTIEPGRSVRALPPQQHPREQNFNVTRPSEVRTLGTEL